MADRAWIVGSSRSGSTWLMKMLHRLGAEVVDDPHLGHHLSVWRPISLAWMDGPDYDRKLATLPEMRHGNPDYFFNDRYRSTWAPHLRAMIDERLIAQTGDNPAVIKDPGASGVAKLLFELFPQDGMIFLLRDPRAVIASWLDGYGAQWGLEDGCYTVGESEDRRLALVSWLAAVWAYRTTECLHAYLEHNGPKCVVRYESLSDLGTAVSEVLTAARVARLETDSATVERVLERSASELAAAQTGDGHRVRRGDPESWRNELTEAELEAINREAGPEAEGAGY